jgi:septal ring factor EnvC (AmiA/AmiB activator)
MKLKGLSVKELKILENRLKNDIARAKETIAAQQSQLKRLRNEVGQVRARRRQLEYRERLRDDFISLQIQ